MKKSVSLALAALTLAAAACAQNEGGAAPISQAQPGLAIGAADGGLFSGGRAKGSFRFDGKEYIISAGGKPGDAKPAAAISIPAIPGVKVEGFIGGARESSVTLAGPISIAGLMARLGEAFAEKGYVKRSLISAEGLASATWILPDGSATARIFAMEDNGSVLAKVVARIEGK